MNTADDIRLHNLQICPDLDSCLYTLSGASDTERGWGRAGETWTVSARTGRLRRRGAVVLPGRQGHRHPPGPDPDARRRAIRCPRSPRRCATGGGPGVTLLPMTDDRVETHVVVVDPEASGSGSGRELAGLIALHFQEWWIRYRAALPALSITPIGAPDAARRRACWTRSWSADLVLVAPSNPVVSIGPILGGAGHRRCAAARHRRRWWAVSPLIAGAAGARPRRRLPGRDRGGDARPQGVGRHYGARSDRRPAGRVPGGRGRRGRGAGLAVGQRTAADDRPRRDRRHGRGGAGARRCRR